MKGDIFNLNKMQKMKQGNIYINKLRDAWLDSLEADPYQNKFST